MDIFKAYATDETKEKEGSWFELPGGEASILVARNRNPNYTKAAAKAFEKLRKVRKSDNEKAAEEVMRDLVARHILLDWKNIEFKGEDLPYSVENAKLLLSVQDFFTVVMEFADDMDNYRVDLEEEVGNS